MVRFGEQAVLIGSEGKGVGVVEVVDDSPVSGGGSSGVSKCSSEDEHKVHFAEQAVIIDSTGTGVDVVKVTDEAHEVHVLDGATGVVSGSVHLGTSGSAEGSVSSGSVGGGSVGGASISASRMMSGMLFYIVVFVVAVLVEKLLFIYRLSFNYCLPNLRTMFTTTQQKRSWRNINPKKHTGGGSGAWGDCAVAG